MSFKFSELPGALKKFLRALGSRWNITLFHYRNHDAASDMVLAGFDVDNNELNSFYAYLQELVYEYTDVSDNLACTFFWGRSYPELG